MNILSLVLAVLLVTNTTTPTTREWRDGIRDVYIDGKLERNAQTLSSSSPRMIAVVCGEEVLLLDPETQEVARAAKSQFTFTPDRTKATTTDLVTVPAGKAVKSGTTYLAASVLVTQHQSKAGAMTIEELYETAPVWRAIADHYQPDQALVQRLRSIGAPVKLEVVLATWCGDSRQHVPRLLKSIAEAANPNITVELIGIDSDFHQPMEVIAGRNITNVPTVIVTREGREVGRVLETPASATVEDDVCDIVAGTPKPHPGRLDRGALLSSGAYVLRDSRRRIEGTEVFEVYEKATHSTITRRDGRVIETWATPTYVEVTTRGDRMTRTRFRGDGENWTAVSRGANGILEQVVAAPAAFVSPATLSYAAARDAKEVFVVPERGMGAVGVLEARVGAGTVPAFVKFADGSLRTLVTR
ncbi:MAG TPA: thioredoxin family protein [Thermoanaerobaculia bacterium]|jgi:thiol-disulfide isomerase/thioredoxin